MCPLSDKLFYLRGRGLVRTSRFKIGVRTTRCVHYVAVRGNSHWPGGMM